jgi:hypothetical protein
MAVVKIWGCISKNLRYSNSLKLQAEYITELQSCYFTILIILTINKGFHPYSINIFITIIFPDVIHRPVFHLKTVVSETEFCLHLWMEPTQPDSIGSASLSPDIKFT